VTNVDLAVLRVPIRAGGDDVCYATVRVCVCVCVRLCACVCVCVRVQSMVFRSRHCLEGDVQPGFGHLAVVDLQKEIIPYFAEGPEKLRPHLGMFARRLCVAL
jgi:hypothetical protein